MNLDKPLVSAIITTHGRLESLKLAIESVKNQTYENLELIVVDDCSHDGTKQWMEFNKFPNVLYHYISDKESKGGNYARNYGVKLSKGNIIAFLDDDDIWDKEKIEKQIKLMNSDVGIVYCGMNRIFEDGSKITVVPNNDYRGNLSKKVFDKIFCTTSMIMMNKKIFNSIGGFDEKLNFWQEYDLLIRACQVTKVNFVAEPLVDIMNAKSDPSRLTNKIDGWLKAVSYVNNKYNKKINELPIKSQKDRKLMIFNDAANRCYMAGDMKRHRYFLKQAWRVDYSLKHFVKFLLNVPNYRMQKLRNKF